MATATQWQTSNPTLNPTVVRRAQAELGPYNPSALMTVQGTAMKTLLLAGILLITASFTWSQVFTLASGEAAGRFALTQSPYPWMVGGAIGGFVLALVTCFAPRMAPYTAPAYAACEGLFLGGISALFESIYPNIALESVGLTVGTLVIMLLLYVTRTIRMNAGFAIAIVAATGAVALTYLVDTLMSLFLGTNLPFLYGNGPVSIGISLVIVAIAAFNLLLDFWTIERLADAGAPRVMEWYGAFSLMVTLVWLYLEILQLLAKLRSRDN